MPSIVPLGVSPPAGSGPTGRRRPPAAARPPSCKRVLGGNLPLDLDLRNLIAAVAIAVLLVVGLAGAALYLGYRKLRRVRIPKDSDFFTTVRAVPLALVVGLDLLDLGLDVFSTPITWLLLDHLGLKALRNVATVKAAIPLGDMIPALTLAWLAARFFKLGRPHDPHLIETERVGPNSYAPTSRRP